MWQFSIRTHIFQYVDSTLVIDAHQAYNNFLLFLENLECNDMSYVLHLFRPKNTIGLHLMLDGDNSSGKLKPILFFPVNSYLSRYSSYPPAQTGANSLDFDV